MSARLNSLMIWSVVAALVVPTFAKASSISVQTGDPQLPGLVSAVWRNPQGQVIHNLQMPVQGSASSTDMAAVTSQQLLSIPGVDPASVSMTGNVVTVNSSPQLDPLDGVFPGGSIYWSTGSTAQSSMKLLSPEISNATIAAVGFFQPFYQPQQPAIFTAGIVTDVGELTTVISAQELNFQTDGPIICQALFQRLAPRAPQFGAQINYAGDRLEVYFDPAYTVSQGGIVFGTSSPSQGYSGTIVTPPVTITGDHNGDGEVDARDYVTWREGLGTIYTQDHFDTWRANFGRTSSIGGVSRATSSITIPEPAAGILVLIGVASLLARGRRPVPKLISRAALATLLGCLFTATTWALPQRVISSSFFEPFLYPQSGPMLDTAIAGVPNFFHGGPADVRVRNWNQLQGHSGVKLSLFDSQGVLTKVTADWIATDVASNNYLNPVINGDSMMMNGYLSSSTFGATGLVTVHVSNLDSAIETAAGYEVWVYADPEGLAQTESLLVDDGIHAMMALTMTDTVKDTDLVFAPRQFDFTTDYDEGTTDGRGVWARFSGLTGNSFTIQALSLNPGESAYINGFQIIGTELAALAGDYNFNRVVDAADYVVWREGLGTTYTQDHYTSWRAHFGQTAGSGSGANTNAAVPEPASEMLLMFAATGWCCQRRRAT